MLVVRQPATHADLLESGERILVLGAQVQAVAAQLHIGHAAMLMVVVVALFFAFVVMVVAAAVQVRAVRVAAFILMVVAGQAILAFQMREGQADVAARRDPRHADRPLR
ncbi:hypothetical protein D3C87_1826570 [compost metagenome]